MCIWLCTESDWTIVFLGIRTAKYQGIRVVRFAGYQGVSSMEFVIWMPLCFPRFGLWIHPWIYKHFDILHMCISYSGIIYIYSGILYTYSGILYACSRDDIYIGCRNTYSGILYQKTHFGILIFWHPISSAFTRWHLYGMQEYIFWHSISEYTFWHPHILVSYIVSVYIYIHTLKSSHLYTYSMWVLRAITYYLSIAYSMWVDNVFYLSRYKSR